MASVEFYGTADILAKLDKAQKNVEDAIISAMKESTQPVIADMQTFMSKHNRTGNTEKSFVEKYENKNGVIKCRIGYEPKKGGLPAIFLNYGTPFIEPTYFIDNAIDNNIDKIAKKQLEVLQRELS